MNINLKKEIFDSIFDPSKARPIKGSLPDELWYNRTDISIILDGIEEILLELGYKITKV